MEGCNILLASAQVHTSNFHGIILFCYSKFEAIADRMSPEAILAQARAAAKEAADTLTLRKPASEVMCIQ